MKPVLSYILSDDLQVSPSLPFLSFFRLWGFFPSRVLQVSRADLIAPSLTSLPAFLGHSTSLESKSPLPPPALGLQPGLARFMIALFDWSLGFILRPLASTASSKEGAAARAVWHA